MLKVTGRNLSHSILLFVLAFSSASVVAQTSVVLENGFENGTDNWSGRGTARVSIAKDQATSGVKSLKISGRTANWHGAQLPLTKLLASVQTYRFTAAVKLAKGEKPDEVKMTIQRGENQYSPVGSVTASPDGWMIISGNFKPSGIDASLLIYVEAERANTAYFIDDFKIESLGDVMPQQSGVILQNDFEDKTAQNWFAQGEGVQMFSSNAAGSQSLKVSGRTQNWHGLAVDVSPLLFRGRIYEISVSARLIRGQPTDELKLTIKQTPPKGEASYVSVASAAKVTDAEWVTLSGKYMVTTSDNNILVYVEATGSNTSFLIDNFSIKISETKTSAAMTDSIVYSTAVKIK